MERRDERRRDSKGDVGGCGKSWRDEMSGGEEMKEVGEAVGRVERRDEEK